MYSKILNFTAGRSHATPAFSSFEGLRSGSMWFQALLLQAWLRAVRPTIAQAQAQPGGLQELFRDHPYGGAHRFHQLAELAHTVLSGQLTKEAADSEGLLDIAGTDYLIQGDRSIRILDILAKRDVFYEAAELAEREPTALQRRLPFCSITVGSLLGSAVSGFNRAAAVVTELQMVASGETAHLRDQQSFRSYALRTAKEAKYAMTRYPSAVAQEAFELRAVLDASWNSNDGSILFQN
ncbi:hypothetical protein D3C71_25630 [compost metagenome]